MRPFCAEIAVRGENNKPALARALFQQTLRKAPDFEGALFYFAQLK